MFWTILGFTAATLTMFGYLPQVAKIIKTKSAKDISLFTLLQYILGVSLWIAYGIHIKDIIVIIANAVSVLIFLIALILYLKYQ